MMGVSVVVCCYNSTSRIAETLKHLALQLVPQNIPWEIIVVDNASTDDTASKALNEWNKYKLHHIDFKVVQQPVAGLSHARDKGVEMAKYEFLVFCDDDNWLGTNYVERVFEIMSNDPQIGVLGGNGIIEPELPQKLPEWQLKQTTVCGPQTWANSDHWVYGAGSVYRKSILNKLKDLGWQQITTGRIGKKSLSGEDVEICFMAFLLGYKIIADDQLYFKHYVPHGRQSLKYIIKLNFWLSYSAVLLNNYYRLFYKDSKSVEQATWDRLTSIAVILFKQSLLYLYQLVTTFKPLPTDKLMSINSTYGTFVSALTNRKKIIDHDKHLTAIFNAISHPEYVSNT